MSKLRLDYFRSLGLELVDKDTYVFIDGKRFINYFAPRKNTGDIGVQPCANGIPIRIGWNGCGINVGCSADANNWNWNAKITEWKPDIEELIKMQDEHNNAKTVKEISRETTSKMFYKKEKAQMKSSNEIEWEGDASYALVNKLSGKVYQANEAPQAHDTMRGVVVFGDLLCVEKAFDLVERDNVKTELGMAKEKQINGYLGQLSSEGVLVNREALVDMQSLGMLAEIILPLKGEDNA